MELLHQHQIRHQIPRFTFRFQVKPHLLVVFFLWIGFASVSLSAMTFGHFATSPSNPFAAFADIFPGQPRSAVDAHGFSCVMHSYSASEGAPNERCTLNPTTGVFSQVSVGVYRDIVQSIAFTIRENTLRVGDLMLLWGKGIVRENSIYSYWHSGNIIATAINGTERFSLFLPVEIVYIQPVPQSTS